MKLENLIELGAMSSDLRLVDHRGRAIISISEMLRNPSKQEKFDGVVIADNCQWAATIGKIPIVRANTVYSSDGEVVCSWNREKRTFFVKELREDKSLHTITQYKFPALKNQSEEKENKIMANPESTMLSEQDLTGLFGDAAGNTAKPMEVFNDGANAPVDAATSSREAAKAERVAKVTALKSYIANSGKSVRDNQRVFTFNQQYGRLKGFVTRTDKAVKVSLGTQLKRDPQGNTILVPNAPEDQVKQHNAFVANAGVDKKIKDAKREYLEKERFISVKEANPGKIVAMIIGIPGGGFVDYGDLTATGSEEEMIDIDTTNTTEHVKILDLEAGLQLITDYFDGRIREDEKIIGAAATWIILQYKIDPKNPQNMIAKMTVSKKAGEAGGRKKVLTTGNYIPLRVYDTINVAEIKTAEDVTALNNNINALFAKKSVEDLCAADRKMVTASKDGGYEYACFKQGADRKPLGKVVAFDDASAVLTTVEIPKRVKTIAKTSGKVSYSYAMSKDNVEDFTTKVASLPTSQKILSVIGYSPEQFYEEVSAFTKIKKPSKSAAESFTPQDARLFHAMNRNSIKDLMTKLAGGIA